MNKMSSLTDIQSGGIEIYTLRGIYVVESLSKGVGITFQLLVLPPSTKLIDFILTEIKVDVPKKTNY